MQRGQDGTCGRTACRGAAVDAQRHARVAARASTRNNILEDTVLHMLAPLKHISLQCSPELLQDHFPPAAQVCASPW